MTKQFLPENHIVVFNDTKIRRTLHNDEWWFSIIDIVAVLTESANARDYWYKMKIRVTEEDKAELSTLCRQLKLEAPDGKMRSEFQPYDSIVLMKLKSIELNCFPQEGANCPPPFGEFMDTAYD